MHPTVTACQTIVYPFALTLNNKKKTETVIKHLRWEHFINWYKMAATFQPPAVSVRNKKK